MFLPRALSTLTDAQTAVQRLDPVSSALLTSTDTQIFAADVAGRNRPLGPALDVALRLSKVTFRWVSPVEVASEVSEKRSSDDSSSKISTVVDDRQQKGFSLDNLDLTIPRGLLIALVGRVGSGKSSLLQGVCCLNGSCAEKSDHR